jgi:quercetin dioxygenase-like cupin family protein
MNKSKKTASGLMTNLPWGLAGISLALLLVAFTCWTASPVWSDSADHKMVTPADLKWQEVPSLPKGAMMAVIEGPMDQAVPFTARLKVPANYKIPPHWHPAVERVTVLSGTFKMALGDKFDKEKATALSPGGMMIIQPKTNHFVWAETESVVQLHGTGPWGITYINPEDDPRKK